MKRFVYRSNKNTYNVFRLKEGTAATQHYLNTLCIKKKYYSKNTLCTQIERFFIKSRRLVKRFKTLKDIKWKTQVRFITCKYITRNVNDMVGLLQKNICISVFQWFPENDTHCRYVCERLKHK